MNDFNSWVSLSKVVYTLSFGKENCDGKTTAQTVMDQYALPKHNFITFKNIKHVF